MSTSQAVPVKDLAEWHAPKSRTEPMHDLIHGVDRYNPTNLPFMEDYLQSQVSSGEYDLLANLAILKLYQFNPPLSNPEVIINILIKSLSATVHGPDFNICLSLLREPNAILRDIDSDEPSLLVLIPQLQKLHSLIQTCQFTKLWAEWNGASEGAKILKETYLPQHAHLLDNLRMLFSTSIASCFSRIRVAQLSRWLDLAEAEINGWCQKIGWTVEGDSAVVPKNGDNDVKAGVVREHVELSQLTKLIAAAAQ